MMLMLIVANVVDTNFDVIVVVVFDDDAVFGVGVIYVLPDFDVDVVADVVVGVDVVF